MAQFLHSVTSVSVILLLTATGYLCARFGWLTAEGKRFLSKFCMTVATPFMCVYGLTTNLTREMIAQSHILLLSPLLSIACNYALAIPVGRLLKLPRCRLGVFVMLCSVSNSMFVGYAMCKELFGDECIPYVMLFYMISTVYTQIIGVGFIRWAGESEAFSWKAVRKFVTSPIALSIIAGYVIVLLDIPLPALFVSYIRYMDRIASPLALLLTGYIIYEIGLKNLRVDLPLMLVMAFRFLVSPLLIVGACALFGVAGLPRSVFVIEAAMPTATVAAVAAAEYGADERFAAEGTALTTLASFIVIPILMVFLQ